MTEPTSKNRFQTQIPVNHSKFVRMKRKRDHKNTRSTLLNSVLYIYLYSSSKNHFIRGEGIEEKPPLQKSSFQKKIPLSHP